MDKENKLILYKDEEGGVSVNTRFADEDVWLTQAQLVEIYQSIKQVKYQRASDKHLCRQGTGARCSCSEIPNNCRRWQKLSGFAL